MNVLFLNMACGFPVAELHASIAKIHNIDKVVILPKKQNYSHTNQTGSFLTRLHRTAIEKAIIEYFPDAQVVEMRFDYKHYEIDNAINNKLKLSVLCSINSHLRLHSENELPLQWRKTFKNLFILSKNIHQWFLNFSKKEKKFRLFCFNGRFCEDFAAIEAVKKTNKNYTVYDLKDQKTMTFYIFNDMSLHSYVGNCDRAKNYFIQNKSAARKIASDFMKKKILGVTTNEKSYTSHQNQNFKPAKSKVISIFPSSDDEYRFLGEDWNNLIVDQIVEIENLIKKIREEKVLFSIIIKMHPNMKYLSKRILNNYYELEKNYYDVRVIKPMSKLNTYDLIEKSEFITVFCSTVGVEANYMRKKVIGIAGSPYHNLPILNKVNSGVKAAELILKGGVKVKSKLSSIIWMNYLWRYSDYNPSIIKFKRQHKFSYSIKPKNNLTSLLVIPSRLHIILLQAMSGIFPGRDRVENLLKILVNK